jgi:hypothetical protein
MQQLEVHASRVQARRVMTSLQLTATRAVGAHALLTRVFALLVLVLLRRTSAQAVMRSSLSPAAS